MAVIARHAVPGTTVTIYVSQMMRGYQVMAMGSPAHQRSVKAKDEAEARDAANRMWSEIRAASQPVPAEKPSILGTQAQIDADDRAMDAMVQAAERAEDEAVAALKASMW